MVNRNMKKYSNLLVVMEIKIKLTIRNYFILIRLAIDFEMLRFTADGNMRKGSSHTLKVEKMKYFTFEGSTLSELS